MPAATWGGGEVDGGQVKGGGVKARGRGRPAPLRAAGQSAPRSSKGCCGVCRVAGDALMFLINVVGVEADTPTAGRRIL